MEFLLISVLQIAFFGVCLWLALVLTGLRYDYVFALGVPFFGILVTGLNLLLMFVSLLLYRRIAMWTAIGLHVVAWGEDLGTSFVFPAIAVILAGVLAILLREHIATRLRTWLT